MTTPWSGRYHSGQTALSHAVDVWLEAGLIRIEGADIAVGWPTDQVRLVGRPDQRGQFRLGRAGTAERVTLLSPEALVPLRRDCRRLDRSVYAGPGWRALLVATVCATVAAVFLFFIALPFVAGHAAAWISRDMEIRIGQQTAAAVLQLIGATTKDGATECRAPAGVRAMGHLTDPLTVQMVWPIPPRIRVIDRPIVNALALPGGQILVFRGIIDAAAGPNELAGVVAHELGHVALGHPTQLAIERGGRSFLIGLMLGDVLGGSVLAGLGHAALEAHFGRDVERAADARGIAFLTGAGWDPAPFGALLERLDHKSGGAAVPFLSDHPSGADRAALLAAVPAGGRTALAEEDWHALKAICDKPEAKPAN